MKTVRDFADECMFVFGYELICPDAAAFECRHCIHKTACILIATVAIDMILEGAF
jgi:hypothetical protein